jgi:hypothetical protein
MANKKLCIAACVALFCATGAYAAPAQERAAASSQLTEKRQAVAGVHADAMAVLAALQRDPTLAKRLAAEPGRAQELLRAAGATRAEQIMVTPDGSGGAARTITITIKIDHVVITIVIDL